MPVPQQIVVCYDGGLEPQQRGQHGLWRFRALKHGGVRPAQCGLASNGDAAAFGGEAAAHAGLEDRDGAGERLLRGL